MVERFLNDLISIIIDTNEDNSFYDHHLKAIKIAKIEISKHFDTLSKLSLFYSYLRNSILFYKISCAKTYRLDEFNYRVFEGFRFKPPTNSMQRNYVELLRLLEKSPLFIADLLHHFKSGLGIMEHLLRSVRLVTCTDPLNPCNQLVQLTIAHYMKQCLYDVKCAVYSKSEAMFLVHLFVFCAVGVRSFSNSLLHNIFFRLTNSCPYIPFYVLKGSENNTENATSCVALNFSTVSLVNIIIESLADNILLFPQPVLVLLGNMRLIWSAAGLSQDDVMRASLEFVFNDFIGSSFEEPELFNITLNVTSFPRILQVLKKTVEVILSLVLECDNCLLGTTATNQNTSKVDRNECARIKVEQLQTFVQFVLSAADSMAFTISVLEEHPESVSPNINTPQFDEPKDDIQRNSFGSVVSLTSNDLNVLIDCIRIVLKKKPNSYPFSKLIDRLPCYVPGATIGVQQSLDNVSSENNLKASNSCTNETSAVLVDISKSIAVKTLTRKIIRSNNDTISSQQRRSRSLNNLFSDKLNSVRHLEEVHDEEQDSNRQRQNMKYDSENLEIVYLFDLNFSYHRNHHHHHSNNNSSPVDLVEKTWKLKINENKIGHLIDSSIPEVTDNGVKINQDYLDVFIKGKVNDHSSTGYGLDGGSLIHGSDESITSSSEYHHSNSKIDTLAKVITNNEQCDVFETQSASPVNITNNLNRDKQLKDNSSQNDFLDSQRSSNETTSQNSDPSGCTSLASSAYALGQRLKATTSIKESSHNKNMGDIHVVSHFNEVSSPSINPSLHNSSFSPPNSPKHDFRDSMSENINDRTTQYVACSSLSRGIEKRTRFSISVLPSTSEVKGFGNTTLLSNRSFTAHSTVPETRHNNSEPVVHSSVVRCSSVDLSQSGLVNCVDLLTERTIKFEGQKSQFAFVSTIPVSNTLKYNDKKSSNKPRCSSLTSLCVSTGSSLLPAHRNSQRLMASTSNQDIEGQGTSSFSVDSASSHSDTDSGLIGAAISQPSTTSSSCHLNSSFMHSFQNSHDQVDVREVDEQSSLLTCSSCGVHLGEDVMPDPIPENSESQDVDNSNGQIGTQVDEQSSYPRDEEDALSDLPLSSANISGRVTPLSLTSATSRGGPLTQSSFPSTENNYRGSSLFPQSGLILPTGTTLPSNVTQLGLTRCGPNDFPSTLFQRHCTSDVTEKFNKFDLPPARLTENETRSTVSDTWSTDVLPSDTEYADLGQEFSSSQANSNPDMVGRRLNSHNAPRVSHRHAHRHHHRRMPVSESIVNETAENNLRPPATAPELDNRGRHLNLQSDLLVDEAANDEEMQNGHNSVEVNNPNHSEVTLPSGTDSQYQDNFDLSSPVDSSSPNRKTSSIQPCSDSVSFAGITDCSTPSTSYTKIQTITIDKDKLRPFRPTDGRRNLNTNRFQGSAHTLKESFSRFMERLDIMTRRQRISANSGIEKQYETSRSSQYNDYQSNLYTLLPDLMESVPIEPGTNKKNHSSMNTSSSAALSWSSKTLSKFNELTTVNKEISDVLSSSSPVMDGAVKNEETVDEMMERYRRQTGITSMADSLSSHQLSNSFYCDEKQVPSTLEGTLNRNDNHKSGDCKSAMKKTSMASSASSSSSSSSSASFSSSYLQSHRSIPQLFNLALHGLQEIFSNSTLSIIALNTINKIRLTWKLIHNQPLSQQVNISSIFHENQILITLLSSMLAGLHDTQQNSTVYDVLMETKNIILELNKRLDIGENFGSVLEKVNHSTIPNDNLPENNSSNSKHHNNSQFNTTNGTSSCPLNKCLISSLRQYLRRRQVYRAHLIKSRQQLNQLKSNLELSVNWLQQSIRLLQQYVTKRNLSELIKQNKQLFTEFYEEFSSEQSYCDPKLRVELVRKLVARLIDKMKMKWRESSFNHSTVSTSIELQSSSDYVTCINPGNNNNSIENVFTHLERLVMDEIYSSVIWINDSAVEEERDDLFHRELGLLQNTITPLELRIPEHYHVILPLQSVQNELRLLDCYHTPSDKLHCLKRVMNHILAALQLAHPTSVPCADDLLPVLIYLIIQANPPRLLSNIEFVNNLGSDNFEAGEIQYIWCQFCSAVAEIRHLMSIRPLNRNSR